jgi:hypothetical protein
MASVLARCFSSFKFLPPVPFEFDIAPEVHVFFFTPALSGLAGSLLKSEPTSMQTTLVSPLQAIVWHAGAAKYEYLGSADSRQSARMLVEL